MATIVKQIKKYIPIWVSMIMLAIIWLVPYLLAGNAEFTFSNIFTQAICSVLVVLISGFVIYLKHLHVVMDQSAAARTTQNLFQQKIVAHYKTLILLFQSWSWHRKLFLKKLPWYLLLGPADSGKTQLLIQADLQPIASEQLSQEVKCYKDQHTWHFYTEAVILELALSSIKETIIADDQQASTDADNQLDTAFLQAVLQFIRRKRYKKRLNGVIITLALPDLLAGRNCTATIRQLKAILSNIYLVRKTQVPLYFMVTQCDLLAGFSEFFAAWTKEEREQSLGITFPQQACHNRTQVLAHFDQEFTKLIALLQQQLLTSLHHAGSLSQRIPISYFPQQLQQCQAILRDLIWCDESTQVRGIYFCSLMQAGAPCDQLIAQLSNHFNLESTNALNRPPEKITLFAKKFFPQIILPDANWDLQYSPFWRQQYSRFNRVMIFSLMALVSLAGGSLIYSWQKNQEALHNIAQYLPIYHQASNDINDTTIANVLPFLTSLQSMKNEYSDKASWWLWLELINPLHIRYTLNKIGYATLDIKLIPWLFMRLQELLQQKFLTAETLYQTLKAYLVFNPDLKLPAQSLLLPMRYDSKQQLPDQPETQVVIAQYISEAITQPIKPRLLNNDLIAQARMRLQQIPLPQLVYYELKQTAENTQEPLLLSQLLPSQFTSVFVNPNIATTALPVIYTYAGYKKIQTQLPQTLMSGIATVYRILGTSTKAIPDGLSQQITPDFWRLYNADYSQYWQQLLDHTHIISFTDLNQAIQILNKLLKVTDNPMQQFLHLVKSNTASVDDQFMQVGQQFYPLNSATSMDANGLQYSRALKTLAKLRSYLVSLSQANDVPQAEFQEASKIIRNQNSDNPILVLRRQAQHLPAPLNIWFTDIANNSMQLLFQGAHQVVNNAWKNTVFPFYQTRIYGRFPFSATSESNVDSNDFNIFLGNDGIFAKYFATYLAPFIAHNSDQWRQYSFGPYTLGLSAVTIKQLYNLNLIQQIYFPNSANAPTLQFSIQPRYLTPEAGSINIQLGNQSLTYRHGPRQIFNWHWPVIDSAQQAGFVFSDFNNQNFSRSFDGSWSWLQLLNATLLQKTATPGRYIWTVKQGDYVASFELWTPNNLSSFDLNLLQKMQLPNEI